ncbi:MAG: signal peptidase II [Dehalococcoidia bacterium]|nr:MAG: signal peptidase II [Dehalococcoidia bacterium]
MKWPIKGLTFFLVAIIVVALDQISKFFIRANMTLGQSIPEEGFFRITYGTNTGGVFGLFANQAFLITLTAIVGVAAILVYSRYPQANRVIVRIALGLLLGGAVGNLIDRIRFGEVVDFIDVGAWPVFNVADSAVVVGVILIIYYFLFGQKRGVGARR